MIEFKQMIGLLAEATIVMQDPMLRRLWENQVLMPSSLHRYLQEHK